jgi:hypothetical protein
MYTRKHHNKTVQLGGASPDGKIPFPLMTKEERFITCRGHMHGSRGSMSDMNSILDQSVAINVRKTGPRSNKIKQCRNKNTEDTQYKRDTDLCDSPSVGYVHQRNC